MTEDDTQLFDPESGTLNPRATDDGGGFQLPGGETYADDLEWDTEDDAPHEHARTTDPTTSHRAAQGHGSNPSIRRDTAKHIILDLYKQLGPMTADEACEAAAHRHGAKMLRAWRRVSDLINGGFLTDTGDERPSRLGRPQRVLRITGQGDAALTFFAETTRKQYRAK